MQTKMKFLLGAMAAALASNAFADSVQLYGVIDTGLTHFSGVSNGGGGAVSSSGLSSGVQSGSAIGLKGSEALSGGLTASFQVETGFCATGVSQDQVIGGNTPLQAGYCTGGGFMQRESYIGLGGSFGQILAGRLYTAAYLHESAIDPFQRGLTGSMGNLGLAVQRSDEAIAYLTPNVSGFHGILAYQFSVNGTIPSATNSNVPRVYVVDGAYDQGPWSAGVSYTHVSNIVSASPGAAANGVLALTQVYGSYALPEAKLSAMYEHQKLDFNPTQKFYSLGVSVPMGPSAFLASWGRRDTGVANGQATQIAVGYTYAFSKTFNGYASYAHISNDSQTAFAVGDATDTFSGVNGQASSGVAVGVRYQF